MVYLSFNHQLLDSLDLLKILSIIYIKSGLIQIVIEKSKQQLKPPRKNNNYQVSRTTIRQYSFILDLKLIYNTYSKYPNLILHQTLKLFIIKKKNLMLLIKLKSYCMIYLFRTSFFLINLYQNKLPNTKIQKQTKNQQKKFTFYLAYVKIKNQLIIVSLNLEKYKLQKKLPHFPKVEKMKRKQTDFFISKSNTFCLEKETSQKIERFKMEIFGYKEINLKLIKKQELEMLKKKKTLSKSIHAQ